MKWKDRDLIFLKYLLESECNSLTFSQIYNNFYFQMKKKSVKNKLRKYMKENILGRTNQMFSEEKIYFATEKAVQVLEFYSKRLQGLKRQAKNKKVEQKYLKPAIYYKAKKPQEKEYEHNKTLNNIRFALEKSEFNNCKNFIFDSKIVQLKRRKDKKEKGRRRMDALFEIDKQIFHSRTKGESKKMKVALEYERTAKSKSRYKNIKKMYEKEENIDAILWIAKDRSTFKNIARHMNEVYFCTKNDFHYITTLDEIFELNNNDYHEIQTFRISKENNNIVRKEKQLFVDRTKEK